MTLIQKNMLHQRTVVPIKSDAAEEVTVSDGDSILKTKVSGKIRKIERRLELDAKIVNGEHKSDWLCFVFEEV